jgi:hypothetical protein
MVLLRDITILNSLLKENYTILDKLYPPLVLSAPTTFHEVIKAEVTRPRALFENVWDKYTIFVLLPYPPSGWDTPQSKNLAHKSESKMTFCGVSLLKPSSGYARQKWCICPEGFQTGLVHV